MIEQFDIYFKPSQSTFQLWYELGSLYSSQLKNQSDFLNKLIDVSKDCNLNNPSELVKFLFLVHNQNAHVHENLLKDMKSKCTLQDYLWIAKLTEGTVHVEKLGQNFFANVDKDSQNVDAVNRGRPKCKVLMVSKGSCRAAVIADVMVELKVMIKGKVHARTVEPVTHLKDVLPMKEVSQVWYRRTLQSPLQIS